LLSCSRPLRRCWIRKEAFLWAATLFYYVPLIAVFTYSMVTFVRTRRTLLALHRAASDAVAPPADGAGAGSSSASHASSGALPNLTARQNTFLLVFGTRLLIAPSRTTIPGPLRVLTIPGPLGTRTIPRTILSLTIPGPRIMALAGVIHASQLTNRAHNILFPAQPSYFLYLLHSLLGPLRACLT
jgi:hypothetical protein